MIQEAALYAGNAEKALQGYAGTQAAFNKTLSEARVELGEAFLLTLEQLMKDLTPFLQKIAQWASANRDLVAGLAASTTAVAGLGAALLGLMPILNGIFSLLRGISVAGGPLGAALVLVGAVAAATVSYQYAADVAAASVFQFARSQEDLNAKLARSPMSRTAGEVQAIQADIDTFNRLLERRKQIQDEINRLQAQASSGVERAERTPSRSLEQHENRRLRDHGSRCLGCSC